jgi:hypothetical protein
VSQESKTKGGNLYGKLQQFLDINFLHEQQVERKKESLELEHPWRENSRACWSIFIFGEKIEEPGCQA